MDQIVSEFNLNWLEKLPADLNPQEQTKIIMDAFERFYRLPKLDFIQAEESNSLLVKETLEKMETKWHQTHKSILNKVEILMDESAKEMLCPQYQSIFKIWKSISKLKQLDPKDCNRFNSQLGLVSNQLEQLRRSNINGQNFEMKEWDGRMREIRKMTARYAPRLQQSTKILENLTKDIWLMEGVEIWNREILKEALSLICFLLDFLDLAGTIMESENQDAKREYINAFNDARKRTGALQISLVDKKAVTKEDLQSITDSRDVSAKTVRELYILNELSIGVLGGRLRVKVNGAKHFDEIKSKITKKLEKLKLENRFHTKRDQAWVPSMIAVVFDWQTGLLLTGASQPSCKNHPLLEEVARKITHRQVGTQFEDLITVYYTSWKEKVRIMQRKKEQGWLYLELKSGKSQDYPLLPAPEKGFKIGCWSVSAHDLKFVLPCPRCARFYSSWDTHRSGLVFDKVSVEKYLNSGRAQPSESQQFHCAETVVAAQIYAFRKEL